MRKGKKKCNKAKKEKLPPHTHINTKRATCYDFYCF